MYNGWKRRKKGIMDEHGGDAAIKEGKTEAGDDRKE